MPDPEAQSIYDELNRRGIFKADKEAQAIGHELRRRKIVIDPTQGGLVNPVTDTAKSWVGKTTYKWGGQSFEHGADCSGFTCRVYEAAGKKLPRTARDQYKVGTPVNSIVDLKPGDQIFFKGTQDNLGPDEASHTGIYLGDGKFVHSSSARGGVVEDDLNKSYWKKKWLGAKRHITTPGGEQPVIDAAVREAVENAKRKILTGKSASENMRRAAAELGMTPEQARKELAQAKLGEATKAGVPKVIPTNPISALVDAKLSYDPYLRAGVDAGLKTATPFFGDAPKRTLDAFVGDGTYDALQKMHGARAEAAKVLASGLDPVGAIAGTGIANALMKLPRIVQLGAAGTAAANSMYQAKKLSDEGDEGAAAIQAGLGIGSILLPGILTKVQTKSATKLLSKLQTGDTVYASPSAAERVIKAIDHDKLRENRLELVARKEDGRIALEMRGIEEAYDKGYTSSNSTGRYVQPQNNKQKPLIVEPEYRVNDKRPNTAPNVGATINEKTGEVVLPKDINANPDRKIIRIDAQPADKPLIEEPAGYAKPIGRVSSGMEKTIEKLNAGEKVSVSLAGSEKIKAAIDHEDLASKNLQLIEKRDGNVITLSIERARQPFDVPKKKVTQIAEPEFKVTDKRPVVKEEKTHEFNPNTGLIEPIAKSGKIRQGAPASAASEKEYKFNPNTGLIEPKGQKAATPVSIITPGPKDRPDINIEKPKPENIGATAATTKTQNTPAAQQKPAQQKPARQKPVAVEEPVTTATAQKPVAKQKIAEQKAAQPKKGEKTLDQALKDLPKTANVGVDPGPYLDVMKAWGKEVAAPNAKKFIEWVKSAKDSRLAEYIRNNDFLNPMNEEVMMSKIRKRASEIFTDEGIARLKSKVVMQDGTDHTANMLKSIRDASISAGMDRRQVDAVLTRMRVFVRGIERKIGRKLTEEETAQAFAVTSKNIVPEGKLTQFVNQEVLRRSDVNAPAVMPGTPSESFLQRMTDVLDEVAARHPNPFESKESWETFQRDVYGATEGKLEPNAPHNLIKYSRDANFVFKDLRDLSPSQRQLANDGFVASKIARDKYNSGQVPPEKSAEYFLWGILSRRASPKPHETGFLTLIANGVDKYIQKAFKGNFDLDEYLNFVEKTLRPSSEAAGVSNNANDFGRYFLAKVNQKLQHGPFKGMTVGEAWHSLMQSNEDMLTLRRKFHRINSGIGIDNKVFDLVKLITGSHDAIPFDRVRFADAFPQRMHMGEEIKTPYSIPQIGGLGDKVRGAAFYEGVSRALNKNIANAYKKLFIDQYPGLGRWHWETWVKRSGQEVAHESQNIILDRSAIGHGSSVTEGRYEERLNRVKAFIDHDGVVRHGVPLQSGGYAIMDNKAIDDFKAAITKQIVPKGLDRSKFETSSWLDDPRVDKKLYDSIAERLAKESAERIGTSEWNKPVRDLPNPKKPSPLAQTVDGKVIGTYDPETAVIELSKGEATPATVAEELYHHLHKILMDADPEASKILTKYYGSYDVKNNRHRLEQAAQEYLKYLETGKAPSDELKPVFSEVAGWMKNVWSGVTGANPPKEVVKLYEMLDKAGASDPFIAAKAKKLNSAYGSVLTQQTLATGAQNEKIQAVQPKEGTTDAVPDAVPNVAIEKEAAKKPASQEANDVTGVAKAITGRDPQEGLSVKQALENGKQAVRLGMDPHSVAKRVLQTGQPMNDTELAAVGVRLREVANASNDILSRIQKANPEDIIGLRAELNNLDAEMETLLSASDLTLNKGFHKLGMAAQIALDKDFQLQSLPARAKAATYNNPSLAPADMDKKIEFFRQENARLKSQLENAKAAVANEIKGGFGTVVPAGLDKAKIKRAMQSDAQWLKTYFGRESGSLAPSAKPMSRNQGAVSYAIPSEEVEAMRRMRRLAKAIAIDKDTNDINVVLGEIKNIVGNVPDEQIYRHLSEPFNKYLLEADVNRIKASKYLQDIQRAADYKMKTPIQKGIYLAGEAFNATARTLQAGADLSAPFIQGKLAITKAPDVWIKSWGPMIKALKDPENAVRLMASIERDPMYSRAKAAGLDLTSMAGPMTAREEMFASNLVSAAESRLLSSDNPTSRALGQALSIYGRSEAAYNAFMNNLRYGMFKKMAMLNPDDPDYLKDIAMAINTATGRGSSKFAKAVGGAQAAGKIFYAPRYTISQWEGAMLRPLTHATTTKGRIEAAKWYAATAAFYAGLTELAKMSGFDVQTDPRATDFGQMQLPNGYKVDLFGKFSKPYSIIAQLMAGKISTTNRYDPASSKKAMEITGQYLWGKLAPVPRIGADLTYGKLTQEKGGAFSARSIIRPNAADTAKEVGKSFLPIWVQSALQEDYLDKPAIAVPSITGIEFNKGKIAKRKAPLVVGAKKR